MEFYDLLPEDPKLYDKMRPPKKDGQATVVYFHVTVMGLDSIDETSMVVFKNLSKIEDEKKKKIFFLFYFYFYVLFYFNFFIFRLMPLIYFSLKPGRTIDCDCRKI